MAPPNRQPARGRRRPTRVAGSRGPGVDRRVRPGQESTDLDTTDLDTTDLDTTDLDTTGLDTTVSEAGDTTDLDTAESDTPVDEAGDAAETDPGAPAVSDQDGDEAPLAGRSATRAVRGADTRPDLTKPGTETSVGTDAAATENSSPGDGTPVAESGGAAVRWSPATKGSKTKSATVASATQMGGRSRPVAAAFAAAAVMLVAAVVLGVFALVRGGGTTQAASSSNVAVLDQAASAEANAATVTILQTAYSYTWNTIGADLDNAVKLMTPEMANQHRASFASIQQVVTDSKTTTKASVVANGIKLLDGDRAEVIAFVTVSGDNGGTALQTAGYRFDANLLKDDGQWKLSGLTAT